MSALHAAVEPAQRCWPVLQRWPLLGMALLCGAAAAQQTSTSFARQWTIEPASPAAAPSASAYRFELPASVYEVLHTQPLAARQDWQVVDAQGQPMPAAWYAAAAPQAQRQMRSLRWFPLPALPASRNAQDLSMVVERDANGQVRAIRSAVSAASASSATSAVGSNEHDASTNSGEAQNTSGPSLAPGGWLIDLSTQPGVQALVLDWKAQASLDAGYVLEASDDLQRWTTLNNDVRLVQLDHDGQRITQNRLQLPEAARYLRLRPQAGTSPLALQSIQGEVEVTPPADHWQWLQLDATAGPQDQGLLFRTGGRFPVERVALTLAQPGSSTWQLQSLPDTTSAPSHTSARRSANAGQSEPAWITRASRWNAWQLLDQGRNISSPALALNSPVSDAQWRLLPLPPANGAVQGKPPQLRLAYRPGHVVFLAQGQPPYQLRAGSATLRVEAADLSAMLAALQQQNGPQWKPATANLQHMQTLAGDAAMRQAPAPADWKPWLLWSVLLLGAGGVLYAALSLLRQSSRQPQGTDQPPPG